jgi:serine/threonine protein kinase
MSDSLFLEPGKGIQSQAGHWYQIVQLLGAGGNAVTYLVVSTSDSYRGTLFALKIFRRLSKPERRDSFLREIKFLQEQNHPAIMRVFDEGIFKQYGTDAIMHEHPFVVAEYLPQTLYQVMRAADTSVVEKISFSTQLLSSLIFLENAEHQVVHRDIKPQNVFVKGRSCVLGDFGLMKVLDRGPEDDRDIFKESIGPGMPFFYRTPDLVAYAKDGVPLTTKTDVFQLGLVLTELFTGRNPISRPANDDILSPVVLERIGTCPGALGASTAALLNRMLIVEVDRRPKASELMDGWMGLFENACQQSRALEGRVF